MSGKYEVHSGRRSVWNGDVHTLCGWVIPKVEARYTLASPTCPGCIAAKKAKKNARKGR
ncbi:hypothetical protein [Actinokineospora enzanensis]|uniref:hypothetical protein n=1 Tax=Actinokineospora enzanensis TaxID=155975 RepID=UPI00036601AB|nr:hypothetical protein [Actinokineospora enzanensis]